jgi:hypothetical protein
VIKFSSGLIFKQLKYYQKKRGINGESQGIFKISGKGYPMDDCRWVWYSITKKDSGRVSSGYCRSQRGACNSNTGCGGASGWDETIRETRQPSDNQA